MPFPSNADFSLAIVVPGPGSTSATPAVVQDCRRDDFGTAEEIQVDEVHSGRQSAHVR